MKLNIFFIIIIECLLENKIFGKENSIVVDRCVEGFSVYIMCKNISYLEK